MRHTALHLFALALSLAAVLPLGAATPAITGPVSLVGLGGSPLSCHVIGNSRNGIVVGGAQSPQSFNRPFYWTAEDGFHTIGTKYGYAAAANNLGQVTGRFEPLDEEASAFLFMPPSTLVTINGGPNVFSLTPQAINDAGQVSGIADVLDGPHAFLWSQAGGFRDLGSLGGYSIMVTDLTENGLVVGQADNANGDTRAFQSRNGQQIRDLGTLGGNLAVATAANDDGTIVGYSRDANFNTHAFVFSKGKMTALPSAAPESFANAINASGMIIGTSSRFGVLTATVWAPDGTFQEINGADIGVAVNDLGVAALTGGFNQSPMTFRAFLWSAATGLLDAGNDDDQQSEPIGITADGRLVARRTDWSNVGKTFIWSPSAGRTLLDGIPGDWSSALYVNAAGKIAGISRTTRGYNRAFVWTPTTNGQGTIVEAPAPDGFHSQPVGLNASGAVAGNTFKPGNFGQVNGPAFYWSGSGTAFDSLGQVTAVDVNDVGQVAGHDFPTSAFVWKNNAFTTIPPLGNGFWVIPYDINNNGQVVGRFNLDYGFIHAFSWKSGATMVDLGTLGGAYSEAVAVNDSGQIAGNSTLADESITHAFKTSAGKKLTDLGTLAPGGLSFASVMNKNGVIAGVSSVDGSVFKAFLYDNRMRDIGSLAQPDERPTGINDLKDVVGHHLVEPFFQPHAYAGIGGGAIVDLPNLGGDYSRAFGVNAAGVVVGDALDLDNQQHAVMWSIR